MTAENDRRSRRDKLAHIDAACDRFERAWPNNRVTIEEVVESLAMDSRADAVAELVLLEIELRNRDGIRSELHEFMRRFPDCGPAIEIAWARLRTEQPPNRATDRDDAPTKTTGEGSGPAGDPSATEHEELDKLIGRKLGQYLIAERLGRGGMGAVFRAQHTLINCERALKILLYSLANNEAARYRFMNEAFAGMRHLRHPNIVEVFDVHQDDSWTYLVMEYVKGLNLFELVAREGAIPPTKAVAIIEQAANGLAFAHRLGIIHRDIKPQNIMLTDRLDVKVLDFGLVRVLKPSSDTTVAGSAALSNLSESEAAADHLATGADALIGTVPYMSPEQLSDPSSVDAASDVYALGCTFYYLLSGVTAFGTDTLPQIIERHQTGAFSPLTELRPEIPEPLAEIVHAMIARDRADRLPDLLQVIGKLNEWRGATSRVRLKHTDRLRDRLIDLGLISSEDWARALADVGTPSDLADGAVSPSAALRFLRRGEKPDKTATPRSRDARSAKKVAPRSSKKLRPADILNRLRLLPPSASGSSSGGTLTDYQVRCILNEDADLLRLPSHVILDEVDSNKMGTSFIARHDLSNETHLIRCFTTAELEGCQGTSEGRHQDFVQRAQQLCDFGASRVARVFGFADFTHRIKGKMHCLTMEFIESRSLGEHILALPGRSSDLATDWILSEFIEICEALHQAHLASILHLDLGPHSIRIDRNARLFVADLGIASMVHEFYPWKPETAHEGLAFAMAPIEVEEEEIESVAMMCEAVLPPESLEDPRIANVQRDIFGVGSAMLFALVGTLPSEMTDPIAHISGSDVDASLEQTLAKVRSARLRNVLETALDEVPMNRFGSMQELKHALLGVQSEGTDV